MSVLVRCFQALCSFHIAGQIYWHKVVYNILLLSFNICSGVIFFIPDSHSLYFLFFLNESYKDVHFNDLFKELIFFCSAFLKKIFFSVCLFSVSLVSALFFFPVCLFSISLISALFSTLPTCPNFIFL